MARDILIAPSILSADFARRGEEARERAAAHSPAGPNIGNLCDQVRRVMPSGKAATRS